MEKNDQLFCCLSVRDFELKILFKGVHLTNSEKMFDRKLYCLSKKKYIYVTVLLLILYSMRKIFSYSINYQTLKLEQNTQNARSVSCVH